MIKAVIFDLGGVLFTNGTKQFITDLSETFHLDRDKVKDVLDGAIGSQYREGKLSRDEFWTQALDKLQITADIDKLETQWISGYKLIEGTKEIITALAKHYKVYYLSDNVRERVDRINAHYDFLRWFEDGIFSHEVGVRKPDPRVYHEALKKAQVKPDEVIFIDDKPVNLVPAQELGMTTILFESPEKLRRDLSDLNVF